MTKLRHATAAVEAFMLYLLTGASCLLIGSSLPQLMAHFNAELVAVTSLSSAFALGRIATVFLVGWLTEKLGPKIIMAGGLVLLFCFQAFLPHAGGIPFALFLAMLGGVGMGTQDAACPVILTQVFPTHYPSAMSAGQAFFGAGCFLPPLIMSFMLAGGLPFYYTYYIFAGLCVVMLAILPLMKLDGKAPVHIEEPTLKREGQRTGLRLEKVLPWVLFGVMCIAYCATTNTINMYTASYASSLGIAEERAVNVLTLYNVGSMVGSLGFAVVLRRVKPVNLLCLNLAGALVSLGAVVLTRSFAALAVFYFLAGLFLGVLFSIAVTLAVGLCKGRAGRAGAIVAMLSGVADTSVPLITGAVITAAGIGVNLWFALGFGALALLAAVLYRAKTKGTPSTPQEETP